MSAPTERRDVSDDAGGGSVGDPDSVASDPASGSRDDRVELALDLLASLERDDLPLSAVVDRIETVTTDPTRPNSGG